MKAQRETVRFCFQLHGQRNELIQDVFTNNATKGVPEGTQQDCTQRCRTGVDKRRCRKMAKINTTGFANDEAADAIHGAQEEIGAASDGT